MARVLVKFRAGYSRYNKGETAAFDEAKAKQLCAGENPVAQVAGPVKAAAVLASDDIDLLDLEREEIAQAEQNLAEQLAEVEAREWGLEAREAALTEREKAIETAANSGAVKEPAAKVEDQPAAKVEDAAEAKDKAPGAPPKQGAKS
ncbi:hypothetical protein [Pseudophaeobacter sp.]|uniref:hypothetical protein n=1 Tax=Pseudophaeobacter sp. TaxID=1971739 RepID=UPI003297A193